MLDTNVLSDLIRNPQGLVAQRIAEVGESAVCTSVVVAAELRYGAAKRNSARLSDRLNLVLGLLEILAFEPPSDARYAQIRAELEAAGTPIGGNDLLIAAHAMASGCQLVTDNTREFTRVAGLEVVNWLR